VRFFLLLGAEAISQTFFIQPLVGTEVQLTTAEQQQKNTIEQQSFTGHNALIEIGNLASSFSAGTVDVEFPLMECGTLKFRTMEAEYNSETDYTWYGEVKGDTTCSCGDGYLLIISKDGQRFGHLSIGGEYYDIAQLSGDKHMMTRSDFSSFTGEECGTTGNEAPEISLPPAAKERNDEYCEIRVLALYNQSTVEAEGGVWAVRNRITFAIAQTNIALKNSRVENTRLVLAGIDSIPGLANSIPGSVQLSVDAVEEMRMIALNPVVRAMRDNVGADIVAFVTGDDYQDPDGGDIFGYAATLDLIDSLAYVLVETGQATTGRYTFAHEIAHILTCRHDFDSDDTPGIMHGYRFHDAKCRDRHTIMHVIPAGQSRIQNYSNPRVKFQGRPTGTADRENNAQQFQLNACTVASFRETNNGILRARIKGESEGCPCEEILLFAEVSGGIPGNYAFEWWVSSDGVNYGQVIDSSSSYVVSLPCVENERVFVRLRATAPDGTTAITFRTFTATFDLPSGLPCLRSVHGGSNLDISGLLAYPNPARSEVTLSAQSAKGGTFFVFSPVGQLLFTAPNILGSLMIPIKGWPSGVYYCRYIDQSGSSKTVRFIIQN
jgi:hypothetical protein